MRGTLLAKDIVGYFQQERVSDSIQVSQAPRVLSYIGRGILILWRHIDINCDMRLGTGQFCAQQGCWGTNPRDRYMMTSNDSVSHDILSDTALLSES